MTSSAFTLVCLVLLVGIVNGWKGSRVCYYNNDPHYRTFDGTSFDYHATCKHHMVKPCNPTRWDFRYPKFEILAQNYKCSRGRRIGWVPACINEVFLRFPNSNHGAASRGIFAGFTTTEFSIDRSLRVRLPGGNILTQLPACYHHDGIRIDIFKGCGGSVVIETSFGLRIEHRRGQIRITFRDPLATHLEGLVCGLCGKYNYRRGDDDFAIPTGQHFPRFRASWWWHCPAEFANIFVPKRDEPRGCTMDPRIRVPNAPPTSGTFGLMGGALGARGGGGFGGRPGGALPPQLEGGNGNEGLHGEDIAEQREMGGCGADRKAEADGRCAIINDPNGPFGNCLQTNDRAKLHAACIADVCVDPKFLCDNLEGYAKACGHHGPTGDWRAATGCHMRCGPNEVYSTAMHEQCLPTCFDRRPCLAHPNDKRITPPENDGFQEGCICRPGFVFNGDACVSDRVCRNDGDVIADVDVNAPACAAKQGGEKVACLIGQNELVHLDRNKEQQLMARGHKLGIQTLGGPNVFGLTNDPCIEKENAAEKNSCYREANRKSGLCPGLFGMRKRQCLETIVAKKLAKK